MYEHSLKPKLKNISPYLLEEFFSDFLLRKVMVEPIEYTRWIPALKLFFRFLSEIEFINNPEKIITKLDIIEPVFMKILRERY